MATDLLVGGSPDRIDCAGQKASATALGGDTALLEPKAGAAGTHCAGQDASATALTAPSAG